MRFIIIFWTYWQLKTKPGAQFLKISATNLWVDKGPASWGIESSQDEQYLCVKGIITLSYTHVIDHNLPHTQPGSPYPTRGIELL